MNTIPSLFGKKKKKRVADGLIYGLISGILLIQHHFLRWRTDLFIYSFMTFTLCAVMRYILHAKVLSSTLNFINHFLLGFLKMSTTRKAIGKKYIHKIQYYRLTVGYIITHSDSTMDRWIHENSYRNHDRPTTDSY